MSSRKEKQKSGATPGDQQRRGKGPKGQKPKSQAQKPTARGRQSKQGVKKKLDKPFKPYMNAEDVSHGLKCGDLVKSVIRINKKKFEQSFVPNPDGGSDIFIPSLHARNRALEGDIVVVRLLPSAQPEESLTSSQGAVPSDLADKAVASGVKDMSISESIGNRSQVSDSVTRDDELIGHSKDAMDATYPLQKLGEVALPQLNTVGDSKVVFIIEKKHSRVATGNIKAYDKSDQTAIFAPADHRLPRVIIPLSDCPDGYVKRPGDYTNTLFVGRITDWPADSAFACGDLFLGNRDEAMEILREYGLPRITPIKGFISVDCRSSHLARSLGEAGDIEPETEGFLIENGIDSGDFPSEVLDCLPKMLPWVIPEDELSRRRDLRSECVFTIDPATARDLDDALHCKQIAKGMFEVGVHIADVSYFVRPKTALDRMAQSRATSVYLVQKVIPMLPRLLCEELCSLNPNEDRLAFSVIWSIDKKGNVHDEWFGRTVIRSCAKMAYAHAQQMIEDPDGQWSEDELPDMTGGHSIEEIVHCVQNMHKIAVCLKRKRFSEGALRLDQPKLSFSMDSETGLPNGCGIYQLKDSNRLIEEFMLLANIAVSHQIYKCFPAQALLRQHPAPKSNMLDDLIRLCSSYGVKLDASSSGSLHASLHKYSDNEGMSKALVLTSLLSRPMQIARYFCTGCQEDVKAYRHYALNVPLYTHFTSPIRRYADVIVHRLLAASLGIDEPFTDSADVVEDIAQNCNDRRSAAKRVQELSTLMFFAIFIRECGPLMEPGMVINVLDKSFDVLVLKYGVVVRVYCEQLPLTSWKLQSDGTRSSLQIVWKLPDIAKGSDQRGDAAGVQDLTLFTPVEVKLFDKGERLKYSAVITQSSVESPVKLH